VNRTSFFAFLLVTLATTHAAAWDSKCTVYADNTADSSKLTGGAPCASGPPAAQGRLRADKLAEHGDIFRTTLIKAGIAVSAFSPVFDTERVPVCAYDVAAPYGGSLRSVSPVSFAGCEVGKIRAFAVDELPMLPDFAYSLSDWAYGNEACPLAGLKDEPADRCHDFATDMGPANSNHFPPQSDRAYKRLHASAVAEAKACAAMRAKVPATDRYRFQDLFRSCERSALAIEAVAHHYLQDDWSTGHMWERWGSPEITGYPRLGNTFFATTPATDLDAQRLLAQATGAISGLIHGVGPLANDSGYGWAFQDAMCYPSSKVRFKLPSGVITPGAGDDQWSALLAAAPDPALAVQREKIYACGVFSVNEVYDAFGTNPALGARVTPSSPPTVTVTSMDDCMGMRATNVAFDAGFGIDLTVAGTLVSASLVDLLASNPIVLGLAALGGGVAAAKYDPFSLAGSMQLATEVTRLKSLAELNAKYFPDGTDSAKLQAYSAPDGTMTLLGVSPNGAYDTAAPAYYDPPYPWTGTDTASTTLRRFFHRADAVQVCDDVSGATLTKLKKLVTDAPPGAQRDANCALCIDFTARHLRVGRDATDYDTTAEPICTYLASKTPAYVYQPMAGAASDARSLAGVYCGCEHRFGAVTDKGWVDVVADKDTVVATGDAIIPLAPGIPRDAVTVGDYRALVTNSVGDVIALSLRLRKEIDTDADSTNGITRMSVKPGTDARGVAVARPTGTKPFALVLSPTAQEMVVFDLDTYLECRRFPLGGVDPWDVVVMPDQKKAYVSFRGTVSAPTDLLEVIDLAAATDCTKAIDCSTPGTGCVKSKLTGIFGAKAGLGSMALSPDGSRLAITARRSGTCGATVNTGLSSTTTMQVGCDSIVAFDTAFEKVITLPGSFTGFYRTTPGSYPYAVGFYPDASRVAYAMFSGPDPWPQFPATWALGFVGLVKTAAYDGKDDYAVALKAGNVVGESLIVESDYLYVGTSTGDITALATSPTFWSGAPASYESSLHGVWYGGYTGACGVGICAKNAPVALGLGSSIRAMLKY